MTSVDTKTCGTIEVWQEVSPQNGWVSLSSGIYAAIGHDHAGRERYGYGKSHSEAIVACMREIEAAKTRWSAPFAGDALEPEPATAGDGRKDLPQAFWDHIDRHQKIQAIKALRDATGLPLITAKNVVDRMIPREPGTPRVPERYKGAALRTLPVATVIRVRGTFSVGTPAGYASYVFEKVGRDEWQTISDSDVYSDSEIEGHSPEGWDVLYGPVA